MCGSRACAGISPPSVTRREPDRPRSLPNQKQDPFERRLARSGGKRATEGVHESSFRAGTAGTFGRGMWVELQDSSLQCSEPTIAFATRSEWEAGRLPTWLLGLTPASIPAGAGCMSTGTLPAFIVRHEDRPRPNCCTRNPTRSEGGITPPPPRAAGSIRDGRWPGPTPGAGRRGPRQWPSVPALVV